MPTLRLVVIIKYEQHLRSWLYAGILSNLNSQFNLLVLAPESLLGKINTFDSSLIVEPIKQQSHPLIEKAIGHILYLSKFRNPSFRYRYLGLFFPKPCGPLTYRYKRRLIQGIYNLPYVALGIIASISSGIAKLLIAGLLRIIPSIKVPESDCYLLVDGETNLLSLQLARSIRKMGVFHINYPDNWDNLSSKMFYLDAPDLLLTWGNQTKRHASEIHKIPDHLIELIGSSRILNQNQLDMQIQTSENSRVNSSDKQLNILYVGFGIDTEPQMVIALNQKLRIELGPHGFKLSYRLHPTQIIDQFDYVQLHEVGIEFVNEREDNRVSWPISNVKFYKELLEPDLIFLAPSTLVLETALLDKRIVLDMRPSKSNEYIDHKKGFTKRTHFDEFLEIKALAQLTDLEELSTEYINSVTKFSDTDGVRVLNDVIFNNELDFVERLSNIVTNVFQNLKGD